jgi:hypothetical protein
MRSCARHPLCLLTVWLRMMALGQVSLEFRFRNALKLKERVVKAGCQGGDSPVDPRTRR